MTGLISVDDARRSDLSVAGWIYVSAAIAGLGVAGWTVVRSAAVGGPILGGVAIGLFAAFIGAGLAHEDATPEADAMCDHCGTRVVSHASRDGYDEVVDVRCNTDPRRARIGPISVVLQRRTEQYEYCSAECAAAGTDGRRMVMSSSASDPAQADRIAATDGGATLEDSADDQGVPQPASGDN